MPSIPPIHNVISLSGSSNKMSIERYFTERLNGSVKGTVEWCLRDIEIKNVDGDVVYEQKGVECPVGWSVTATTIAAQKYFRGHGEERESSIWDLIDRIVSAIASAGFEHRYYRAEDRDILKDELRYLMLHQMMAFNSPVWFNVGTCDEPQSSACFILDVEDDMKSILNWVTEEGLVFRKGSGAGVNISKIREKNAPLSGGGCASGPMSFAASADRSASAIKSGGRTRRAAKLLCMDIDHPDIEEFIAAKVGGEKVAKALIAGGFDPAFNVEGGAYDLSPWQNANNSVRLTDDFMSAVNADADWDLTSRVDGSVVKTVRARELFHKVAEAAWECGDPGVQFHDIINRWNTCPNDDKIVASNPCSEYHFLNNTACNLASLNLAKYDDGSFLIDDFIATVQYTILAQDILVSMSSYPTPKITKGAKKYRTLGIGVANLGAMVMSKGYAYDSNQARYLAGGITSLLSSTGYHTSSIIASCKGAFGGFFENKDAMMNVMDRHSTGNYSLVSRLSPGVPETEDLRIMLSISGSMWAHVNVAEGLRNAQISVAAPTGTISLIMDCDTTGVEPDIALVKYKKLVGGGTLKMVNSSVGSALRKLGYDEESINEMEAYITANDTIEGAPSLRLEHEAVFDCALKPMNGRRFIAPNGHIDMMAACQPFLSGAISKTVNMPAESTVKDIEDLYMRSWDIGLKSVAIYRDGCKQSQPVNLSDTEKKDAVNEGHIAVKQDREKLPADRMACVHKFNIQGHEGYLTLGYFPDGRLGEVFVNMSKKGSTLSGLMDAWATMVSLGIQYGIPLDTMVAKFRHTNFEPSGFTANPKVRSASSIVDYVAQVIDQRRTIAGSIELKDDNAEESVVADTLASDEIISGPPCAECGYMTVRAGACYKCDNCGATTGCG